MSNDNNTHPVPTEPGWWYRDKEDPRERIVFVSHVSGDLARCSGVIKIAGETTFYENINDGLWLGPVPMPGGWVSVEQYDSDMADCTRAIANRNKPTGWML